MIKKILIVFHDNNMHSGATKSMLTNVEYLCKQENKFELWAVIPNKKGDLELYLKKLGIPVIVSHYGGNVYKANLSWIKSLLVFMRCFIKTLISYISCFHVSKKLESIELDIIYTNTSTLYYGAWLSKWLNAKHIWHFREFCYEDQNSLRIFDRYFKRLARESEKIITISNIMNEYYIKKYNLSNTIMLYNDISPKYEIVHKENHTGTNILITGTLSENKGQLIAIQAIEKLKHLDIKLYIAGGINSYGEKLVKYVKDRNLENVIFCGLVPNMAQLRQRMDISLVCAKKEAFGRTIIEDMLANILVIACNTGSVNELIRDNETGIIYRYNQIDELADKITNAINQAEKTNIIKKNARIFADRFIKFNTAKEIKRIMEE